MPGFLTHYIAGQAVLNELAPDMRKKITSSERLYNLGTQGPDIFFYYIPGIVRKRSRGVGSQMHQSDLGLFLMQMANAAKQNTGLNRDIIFAYTSGFIMHYAVDTNAHPYVYASTYDPNASKINNSAKHHKFETAIDILMLKLVEGKKPSDHKQWELINANKGHMKVAAIAASNALLQIYSREIPPKNVYKAMRHMCAFTRFIQSQKGRRKKFIGTMENLTIRHQVFSSIIHNQVLTDGVDYLNEQKKPWQSPWDESKNIYTDSFADRFYAATTEGLSMIQTLYKYIYENLPAEALATALGNRSLKTGQES